LREETTLARLLEFTRNLAKTSDLEHSNLDGLNSFELYAEIFLTLPYPGKLNEVTIDFINRSFMDNKQSLCFSKSILSLIENLPS
jgi:hypothetical protein